MIQGWAFELIPGRTAVIDEGIGILEHAVGQPVVAQELPDVLLAVELGALGRQRHNRDVARHREFRREVPARLVEQQCRMTSGGDIGGNRREVQVHGRGIAKRQDQSDGLALLRTDRTKDIGGGGALVGWCRRTAAAPRPAAGNLVLLADPGLITEPDLYIAGIEALLACDRLQGCRPVFLKAAMAPSA